MHLAISTTETLTDLKTDLVVANNNNIDIYFVFTMYLINLADTNRRYSGYCFFNQIMILMFCIFKSLIGTDMTYHFSVDVPLRI